MLVFTCSFCFSNCTSVNLNLAYLYIEYDRVYGRHSSVCILCIAIQLVMITGAFVLLVDYRRCEGYLLFIDEI